MSAKTYLDDPARREELDWIWSLNEKELTERERKLVAICKRDFERESELEGEASALREEAATHLYGTLPRHKCGLYLTHNEHKDAYMTAKAWLEEQDQDLYQFPDGERQRCIETGEVWTLHWYPDTPIGFYAVAASTLEAVLAEAERIQREADGTESSRPASSSPEA